MINVNDFNPQMLQSFMDKVEVLEKMFYDYNGKGIRAGTITGDKIVANSITATQIDATNLHVVSANIDGKLTATQIDAANLHVNSANIDGPISLGYGSTIEWTYVNAPSASQVGALDSSYSNRLTKITSSGIYTGSIDAGQITSGVIYTDKLEPYTSGVITFQNGTSLDCRNGAARLRYNSSNYVYISSGYIAFYSGGSERGGCDSGGLYTMKSGTKTYV